MSFKYLVAITTHAHMYISFSLTHAYYFNWQALEYKKSIIQALDINLNNNYIIEIVDNNILNINSPVTVNGVN